MRKLFLFILPFVIITLVLGGDVLSSKAGVPSYSSSITIASNKWYNNTTINFNNITVRNSTVYIINSVLVANSSVYADSITIMNGYLNLYNSTISVYNGAAYNSTALFVSVNNGNLGIYNSSIIGAREVSSYNSTLTVSKSKIISSGLSAVDSSINITNSEMVSSPVSLMQDNIFLNSSILSNSSNLLTAENDNGGLIANNIFYNSTEGITVYNCSNVKIVRNLFTQIKEAVLIFHSKQDLNYNGFSNDLYAVNLVSGTVNMSYSSFIAVVHIFNGNASDIEKSSIYVGTTNSEILNGLVPFNCTPLSIDQTGFFRKVGFINTSGTGTYQSDTGIILNNVSLTNSLINLTSTTGSNFIVLLGSCYLVNLKIISASPYTIEILGSKITISADAVEGDNAIYAYNSFVTVKSSTVGSYYGSYFYHSMLSIYNSNITSNEYGIYTVKSIASLYDSSVYSYYSAVYEVDSIFNGTFCIINGAHTDIYGKSSTAILINSTVANVTRSIYAIDGSSITLLNTTYNGTTFEALYNSTISVEYYLTIVIESNKMVPIAGVNVTVMSRNAIVNRTTDNRGEISWLPVTYAFYYNGLRFVVSTNISITSDNVSFSPSYRLVVVTHNDIVKIFPGNGSVTSTNPYTVHNWNTYFIYIIIIAIMIISAIFFIYYKKNRYGNKRKRR